MSARDVQIMVALHEVKLEVAAAVDLHAPFNSAHEGYAVILEELDELWEHVRGNTARGEDARQEAVQVAAMAVRFAAEIAALAVREEQVA